jgi:hypothetical protein
MKMMSDTTVPKIYIHLSRGRIVETRMEAPTEPPQWGDDLSDWTVYVSMAEIERLTRQLKEAIPFANYLAKVTVEKDAEIERLKVEVSVLRKHMPYIKTLIADEELEASDG